MDHDSEELHERFWRNWEFLHSMARHELATKGLHHHEPADIVTHVMRVVTWQVDQGKISIAQVRNWRGLFTQIARNEVLNQVRASGKVLITAHPEELAGSWTLDESMWERLDLAQRRKLLQLLPDPLRCLMVMRYEDGMSLAGAAAVAGVSPKQARQMIDGLCRKVELVERGGTLRGPDAQAITAFAHGILALRDDRSGRD